MKIVDDFNIVIIGGGPAGISAGIYSKYDGNNPIILEAKTMAWIPENHINLIGKIEGLPGLVNKINGSKLKEMLLDSLREMQVKYKENAEVLNLNKKKSGEFLVSTKSIIYKTRSIILCTGTLPKKISCPGSIKYRDYIHSFAYENCKDYKKVVVLGGRNSGATAAIYLAKKGLDVTILEIKDILPAKEKHVINFSILGIKVITGAKIQSLNGGESLRSVTIKLNRGDSIELEADAVYCYIGVEPNNSLLHQAGILLNDEGYSVVDFYQRSSLKGVFVAGDICGDLKHVVASMGQGAKAAYNANKYLLGTKA